MTYKKPKRISDPSLIEQIRDRHVICIVGKYKEYGLCSDLGSDIHHIHTRRSGGGDIEGNLILLCRHHHNMVHNGLIPKRTLKKYLAQIAKTPKLWILGDEDNDTD